MRNCIFSLCHSDMNKMQNIFMVFSLCSFLQFFVFDLFVYSHELMHYGIYLKSVQCIVPVMQLFATQLMQTFGCQSCAFILVA